MDYDKQIEQLRADNLRTQDPAAYQRLHKWIRRLQGDADSCSENASHTSTRYHWSNISGKYKQEVSDWRKLCPSCHARADYTPEHRKIMSYRSTGNYNAGKQVVCLDTNTSYRSARDAARSVGILFTSINNCLTGRSQTAGRLHWQYKED